MFTRPYRVSLVALPEAALSTLSGVYDVLNAFALLGEPSPFQVEIVGETVGPLQLASGMPVAVQRAIGDVAQSDIVIVPSVVLPPEGWRRDRYPELVAWAARMHAGGALLCSACSGIFLLAETGLFDGRLATVHFGYARIFAATFPQVPIDAERVLIVAGEHDELVTSGASMTWHDLVLYLIARHAGSEAARRIASFFALQFHVDGLAPFMAFEGASDHGDRAIAGAQRWLAENACGHNPLGEAARRSGLSPRTFHRRFSAATGHSPIAYLQRLRIEEAKRRLESGSTGVDAIAWEVGYEDPAFFRRLFKRVTGLPPAQYRKRFRVPQFASEREAPRAPPA
jgi:transcriptional regulator GlxA family with amidase domain